MNCICSIKYEIIFYIQEKKLHLAKFCRLFTLTVCLILLCVQYRYCAQCRQLCVF
jgi:hypothetical protein